MNPFPRLRSAVACLALACFALFALPGCATSRGGTTPTFDQDLLSFAETAQNVVQDANTGATILAPLVSKLASASELVFTAPQKTAILNKIIAVSNQVSAAAVANGLPPASVQAAVSAVNTPAAAAAIVQQVTASAAQSSTFAPKWQGLTSTPIWVEDSDGRRTTFEATPAIQIAFPQTFVDRTAKGPAVVPYAA
jgi:hypothetical protein